MFSRLSGEIKLWVFIYFTLYGVVLSHRTDILLRRLVRASRSRAG